MTPEQRRVLNEILEAGEQARERENRRFKESQDALDSKATAEHNHRIVALEVAIVGVVIPLLGSQSGIGTSMRISGGALLASAITSLAWDVFAPVYRRPVLSAGIDLYLASGAAATNRSRTRILESNGFDSIASELSASQPDLDRKESDAVMKVTAAWGEVQKFDTRMRVVAYGLLIVGLSSLLWTVLFLA